MENSNTLPETKYENMKNKDFLERLDKCLKNRNWTRYRLAQEISGDFSGIGTPGFYNTINSWYKGEGKYPSIENMIILADTLNVSIDYLLGRHEMTSVDSEYIYIELGINSESQEILKLMNMFRGIESDVYVYELNGNDTFNIEYIDNIDILNLYVMKELDNIVESIKDYYNNNTLLNYYINNNPMNNYSKIRKVRMSKEMCKGKLFNSFNSFIENIDNNK